MACRYPSLHCCYIKSFHLVMYQSTALTLVELIFKHGVLVILWVQELQLQRLSADDDWAEPSEEVASSMCRALSKLLKLRSVKMEFCYIQDVPSDYDVSSGFMASVSLLTKIRYFLGFSKLLQPRMRGLVIAVRISAGPPPPLTSKIG